MSAVSAPAASRSAGASPTAPHVRPSLRAESVRTRG